MNPRTMYSVIVYMYFFGMGLMLLSAYLSISHGNYWIGALDCGIGAFNMRNLILFRRQYG